MSLFFSFLASHSVFLTINNSLSFSSLNFFVVSCLGEKNSKCFLFFLGKLSQKPSPGNGNSRSDLGLATTEDVFFAFQKHNNGPSFSFFLSEERSHIVEAAAALSLFLSLSLSLSLSDSLSFSLTHTHALSLFHACSHPHRSFMHAHTHTHMLTQTRTRAHAQAL